MHSTFIPAAEVAASLNRDWVIVDCRYMLGDPGAGRAAYLKAHIPGAGYADLETDLSGTVIPDRTGRHPLPDPKDLVATLRRLGIDNGSQVVAYDAGCGQMAAARLWWLLRWAGHDAVAVLDGGITAWTAAGLPLASGEEPERSGSFQPAFREDLWVATPVVAEELGKGSMVLVDSRAADRYRGENESIDPVAGHIPGAASLPFAGNLRPDGKVRSSAALRSRFADLDREAADVVFYCGSGVTAAQNALAYAHAGLGTAKLYPGSWSEWIAGGTRPVEVGEPA